MRRPRGRRRSAARVRRRPSAARHRRRSSESRRCPVRTGRPPSESRCAFRSTRRRAAAPRAAQPGARTSAGLRGAGGEEADEVRHVAAAHQQAVAVGGKPNQLGDPADGLRFDLGGDRRQPPGADVLVDRRRQQIAERADRRGARRDVAEESRMSVEERVLEEQLRRFVEQRTRVGAALGQRPLRVAARGGRRPATRRASPDRRAAAPASRQSDRRDRGRRRGTPPALMSSGASRRARSRSFVGHHRNPSKRSDSRAPAAVHEAERAIKLLHAPQRPMVLRRQAVEVLVNAHLRAMALHRAPARSATPRSCRSAS